MPASQNQRVEALLDYLDGNFMITRSQFRYFMQISPSSAHRLFKSGKYPRYITLPNGGVRIALDALAEWMDKTLNVEPKKCGRPVGSRNKPKVDADQAQEDYNADSYPRFSM